MMRICVTGECPASKALRGYLCKHDFYLTDQAPDWTVHIEESEDTVRLTLDSTGGELEQALLRHIRKQTSSAIEIHTARTVSSEREIRIVAPLSETDRKAVETGVLRGLLEITKQDLNRKPWWSQWWTTMMPGNRNR
jgi:hypothetical protein